ncbi:hypothetical protein KKC32_03090 [Patescibacteria group bacterium]|nr:hypothetical protein [Patescibacteria group bacterium]
MQQKKFGAKVSYVYLAIDIPKNNLQTPKAVENIFTTLAGAHTPLDWHEKTFKGQYQVGFSFEIVSMDGYVQFVVRTPVQFRDLVEAAIYSQYPEAQITETEDYTNEMAKLKFPNDEYNLWGADLVPVREDYFPFRTYLEFQEELDKEFKDPIASMLEIMNKIGPGEQIWFQIIAVPADNDWMKKGTKAVNKIMGIKEAETSNLFEKLLYAPLEILSFIGDQILGAEPQKEERPEKFNMMMLNPQQKREVEAVMEKIDKICFDCKVRYLYVGKKEVFKKGLAVSGIMGAIKQFSTTGLNALKPGANKTQTKLMLKDLRLAILQNSILKNYIDRNTDTLKGTYILSVAELATLYHFPYIEVKAPTVKKTESKRVSAPAGLPVEEGIGLIPEEIAEEKPKKEERIPVVDYDNDYFEERFALDKTGEKDKARKEKIISKLKKKEVVKKTAGTLPKKASTDNKRAESKSKGAPPRNLPFE